MMQHPSPKILRLTAITIWSSTVGFAWLLFKGITLVWSGLIMLIPILLFCWMRLNVFLAFRLIGRQAND